MDLDSDDEDRRRGPRVSTLKLDGVQHACRGGYQRRDTTDLRVRPLIMEPVVNPTGISGSQRHCQRGTVRCTAGVCRQPFLPRPPRPPRSGRWDPQGGRLVGWSNGCNSPERLPGELRVNPPFPPVAVAVAKTKTPSIHKPMPSCLIRLAAGDRGYAVPVIRTDQFNCWAAFRRNTPPPRELGPLQPAR